MAEPPNGDNKSGDHYLNNYGTQGFSSTNRPMDNLFDFTEDIDMSEIFDLLENQPPTNNIPSSLMENVVPNHQNPIEIGGPSDHPNTLEVQDDYSLSYIFSMGTKNVALLQEEGGEITSNGDGIEQENPITNGLTTNQPMPKTPILEEQENPSTNDMILQQPMPKTPILEEQENPSSNDMILQQPMPKTPILEEQKNPSTNDLITNQPMPKEPILEEQENPRTNGLILQQPMPRTPISSEQENPSTNAMMLQQPMPTIPCLLKAKERNFMNSKYTIIHPFGTSSRREQETPKANPPMTRIPVSEKEESDFLRPKMTNIRPFMINSWKEKQTPKTNNLILNTSLEKKESEHMKSKLINTNSPYGISKCNLLGIGTGKTTRNAYFGTRTTRKDDESRYGVLNSFELPQKTSSSSGGPIRRSLNQTSSRYQPIGRQISNNQGSNRFSQSSSESTFNRSQAADGSVVCDIGKLWKHQRKEIKRKTGIASYYAGSSNIHRQIWNNLQNRSLSPQVAAIEKRNSNGEYLIGGTSSKKDNHSMLQNLANQNFQNSRANSHEFIANEINSGIAGGQSMINQGTSYYSTESSQSWGYAQGISLGNGYGAQLQQGGYYAMETGNEIMDARYSGYQATGNEITDLQSSGFQAMGNEITNVQYYSGVQATGNVIEDVQYSGVQAMANGIMDVQYSGFQAAENGITGVQYSGFQAAENGITGVQYSGFQTSGNGITNVQYSGFQAARNEITDVQYSGVQATGNEITGVQYSGYAQGISGSQSFNPEETHFDVTNWQFGDESQGNI